MKKIIISLCIIVLPFVVKAQFVYSDNQQLVVSAIENSLFVLRQSYQLKDTLTNEYYGRGGRNDFGTLFSLGVKLQQSYCVTDKAIRPWEHDENFNRYRSSNYVPIIIKTHYKELCDSCYYETLEFHNRLLTEIHPNELYQLTDSTFNKQGFETDTSVGKRNGWLVWLVAANTIEKADSVTVSYIIYRKELNRETGKNEYEIDAPSTNQHPWGGIFIVPEQTAIGQITFRLAGILMKKEDKWRIITPFTLQNAGTTVIEVPEETIEELTLVEEKSTKKKTRKQKK
ncbi:hypothetical protein [Bacteroides sp. 519]|uniref:hypothetical protein n=1 Tax=Bacteroides sp. 519 TaxID=2302937 RepID=UPI0013D214BB|nr:hypothetical protein [Bacteroides sp. 519]